MPPEAADRTTRTPPRRSLHEFENVCPETDIRMKRVVALWLCATVWLSAGGQSRDWANTGRYAAANAALAVRPKVVFIGDSITEGWYSAHPSFFDANGFAARGISGQVTAQMLARFQCDVVALRPRAVVILAGTNDIARNNGPIDEERIADNIRSMAELARAHGMRVFLCSVLPAARYGWRPEVTDAPDRIDRLNRMLREYALDNGCEWVDFHPGLADADRALDARYTRDGVHPTSDGFDAMEAILRPYLKRYLR